MIRVTTTRWPVTADVPRQCEAHEAEEALRKILRDFGPVWAISAIGALTSGTPVPAPEKDGAR